MLAGIGFTVSIFVTELAFDQEQLIAVSKLSIFAASVLSGFLGLAVLRYIVTPEKR
jgi:NhaA family Na+:H+ antiporter